MPASQGLIIKRAFALLVLNDKDAARVRAPGNIMCRLSGLG
jgi:hypothetical protein